MKLFNVVMIMGNNSLRRNLYQNNSFQYTEFYLLHFFYNIFEFLHKIIITIIIIIKLEPVRIWDFRFFFFYCHDINRSVLEHAAVYIVDGSVGRLVFLCNGNFGVPSKTQ